MSGPSSSRPADDPPSVDGDAGPERDGPAGPNAGSTPDLSSLPIAGITRRGTAAVLGVLLAVWIVAVFARQVGDASAATDRAHDIAAANARLGDEVAALERELELIGRQRYIEQQARAYGLGSGTEIAFSLAADAPPLTLDAPGSAAVRVGAIDRQVSPLERWLTVLFGPSD